ncbi:MAG: hypothetical protein ACFFD4_00415 [Candidatus Odinarchaeota archaeon]
MKNFIDLIRPGDLDKNILNSFVMRSIWLGSRGLLVEAPPAELKSLKAYRKEFREDCLTILDGRKQLLNSHQRGIIKQKLQYFDLWPCLMIEDDKEKPEIKAALNAWRKSYTVICVKCNAAEITKWAVQDNRVDGILFPQKLGSRLFDLATARMCKQQDKFLLVPMARFLANPRVQIARDSRRMLFYAEKKDCAVICCTRAANVNHLRTDLELAGLLAEVSGYPGDKLVKSMNSTLSDTVKRNLFKNSPDYVGPGVTIIRGD